MKRSKRGRRHYDDGYKTGHIMGSYCNNPRHDSWRDCSRDRQHADAGLILNDLARESAGAIDRLTEECVEKGWIIPGGPPKGITPREDVLTEAVGLITGDRNETYGSPTQNFTDTAMMWTVILRPHLKDGETIAPGEVASMMIALKLCRQVAQPKRDNWVDVAGYAGCGYEADRDSGRVTD